MDAFKNISAFQNRVIALHPDDGSGGSGDKKGASDFFVSFDGRIHCTNRCHPPENGTFPDSTFVGKNWIEKRGRSYKYHSKSCSMVLMGKCGYDRTILKFNRTFDGLCAMGENK